MKLTERTVLELVAEQEEPTVVVVDLETSAPVAITVEEKAAFDDLDKPFPNYGFPSHIKCEWKRGDIGRYVLFLVTDTVTGEQFGAWYSPVRGEIRDTFPLEEYNRLMAL